MAEATSDAKSVSERYKLSDLEESPRVKTKAGEYNINAFGLGQTAGKGINESRPEFTNNLWDQLLSAAVRGGGPVTSDLYGEPNRLGKYIQNNYSNQHRNEVAAKEHPGFPNALAQASGPNPAINPETGGLTSEVLADFQHRAQLAQQAIPSTEGEQIQAQAYKSIADLYKGENPDKALAENLGKTKQEQLTGHLPQAGEKDTGAYRKGILEAEGEKEKAFETRKTAQNEFEKGLQALQAKYPTLSEAELRKTYSPWYRALVGGLQSLAHTGYSPIDQEIKGIRDNYTREYNDLVRSEQVSEDKYRLINEQYASRMSFMEKLASIEAEVYKQKYDVETSPIKKAQADINYGTALSNASKAQAAQASAQVQLDDNMRAQVQTWASNPKYVATGVDANGIPKYIEIKSDKPDEISYVKKELPGLQVAMSAAQKVKQGLAGKVEISPHEYDNLVRIMQAYSTQIQAKKTQSVNLIDFGIRLFPQRGTITDIADSVLAYGNNFLLTYTKLPAMNPLIMANGAPVMPNQPKKR